MKNILSLFNGISAMHLALIEANKTFDQVYYAEIDKHANKVTETRFPEDIALGDVLNWKNWDIDWSSIDLIGAGFPCQSWSLAGKQLGDKDPRGQLFWTTLEIIAHAKKNNPNVKFVMENVKMKKEFEDYITEHTTEALGYVEKTLINSSLLTAQNRSRFYWTNFSVTQPEDKGLLLKDILENFDVGVSENLSVQGGAIRGRYNPDGSTSQVLELNNMEKTNALTTVQKDSLVILRPCERIKEGDSGHIASALDVKGMDCIKRIHGVGGKSPTLTTMGGGHREPKVLVSDLHYRKLTPLECERLQAFPDNWTSCLSNTQRYKSIGNAWTVSVISHILSHID